MLIPSQPEGWPVSVVAAALTRRRQRADRGTAGAADRSPGERRTPGQRGDARAARDAEAAANQAIQNDAAAAPAPTPPVEGATPTTPEPTPAPSGH